MKPFITPELSAAGQKVLRFQCEGLERRDLAKSIIGRSIIAYAIPKGQTYRAAWLFQLILDDGSMLEFSSACTQVVDWQEVGSLNIRLGIGSACMTIGGAPVLPTTSVTPFRICDLDMLIYEDGDVVSECGLIIRGLGEMRVVIAAGIPPGSVSIAAPYEAQPFEPQFAISTCALVSMQ